MLLVRSYSEFAVLHPLQRDIALKIKAKAIKVNIRKQIKPQHFS